MVRALDHKHSYTLNAKRCGNSYKSGDTWMQDQYLNNQSFTRAKYLDLRNRRLSSSG